MNDAAGQRPALARYFTYRLNTLTKLNDLASQALYLQEGGLALSESRALASIGSFPRLTVNQLAFEANLDKGQASRAAQALVDKGLVQKVASAHDGRSVFLELTADGLPVWQRLMRLVEQRNAAVTGCLSAAEQEQLLALFERMLAHAKAQRPPPTEAPAD
ncbi:MarR family transcriptional regulator [Hydrogenophaga sp.]|uniref:MarR family winged helix-turn-helix transcriptional regulator n=1 Tax=Hydrogenophaga sp. TaxID=1904254 RepID=UPI00286D85EF|nr:MarR family transcriptional regulator [Hydrogenophaga sp.]